MGFASLAPGVITWRTKRRIPLPAGTKKSLRMTRGVEVPWPRAQAAVAKHKDRTSTMQRMVGILISQAVRNALALIRRIALPVALPGHSGMQRTALSYL